MNVWEYARELSGRLNSYRHRHGFTLIELLVVMLIIGLLMALLIPAVNATRESTSSSIEEQFEANRPCHRQLPRSKGNYPPSWLAAEPPALATGLPNIDGWSIHILLLPYLEQKLLYDEIDFTRNYNYYVQPNTAAGTTPPLFTLADGSTTVLSTLRVPTYVSPAEPRDEIRENKHYPTNYAVNMGTWFVWDPNTKRGGDALPIRIVNCPTVLFPTACRRLCAWPKSRHGSRTSAIRIARPSNWEPPRAIYRRRLQFRWIPWHSAD